VAKKIITGVHIQRRGESKKGICPSWAKEMPEPYVCQLKIVLARQQGGEVMPLYCGIDREVRGHDRAGKTGIAKGAFQKGKATESSVCLRRNKIGEGNRT